MGTGSFPGVKLPGRGVDHPPLSKCLGYERVGLYLYSPSGPQWPVTGRSALRFESPAVGLLGSWVHISTDSWLCLFSCEWFVSTGRLIPRQERSYRAWCVWAWSWRLNNDEDPAHQGLWCHKKRKNWRQKPGLFSWKVPSGVLSVNAWKLGQDSPASLVFPCQYHSAQDPWSYFIHLSPTLHNLSNWQRRFWLAYPKLIYRLFILGVSGSSNGVGGDSVLLEYDDWERVNGLSDTDVSGKTVFYSSSIKKRRDFVSKKNRILIYIYIYIYMYFT